ncbi:hypothetical protein [Kribbella italica]|uniref:Uncharacterized protein n=1 Tax=Kribbella italica TaxID=1540520 RepID=A0A7W9JCB3_9ACTN|nr:hypothetical protein [Kribbella italica]MBB5839526.1 hypothetical protein [Kribbella italica]
MTVLWIVVGVVVVLLLLVVFTGAAKKSQLRSTEQAAREHELQVRAATAHPDDPPTEAGAAPATGQALADDQRDSGAAASAEPVRATTPHTATWGDGLGEEAAATSAPAPTPSDDVKRSVQSDDVEAPVQSDRVEPVIDEEGDGCPSDMDSEHFGGVLDGKRPE